MRADGRSGPTQIVNSGDIETLPGQSNSFGIYSFSNDGAQTIENTGSITTLDRRTRGINITTLNGATTIVNSGDIDIGGDQYNATRLYSYTGQSPVNVGATNNRAGQLMTTGRNAHAVHGVLSIVESVRLENSRMIATTGEGEHAARIDIAQGDINVSQLSTHGAAARGISIAAATNSA